MFFAAFNDYALMVLSIMMLPIISKTMVAISLLLFVRGFLADRPNQHPTLAGAATPISFMWSYLIGLIHVIGFVITCFVLTAFGQGIRWLFTGFGTWIAHLFS
jgi:hypothetical protein